MKCLNLAIALLLTSSLHAQIVINEVIFGGSAAVELKNTGYETVDVSSYVLCSFPTYNAIGSLTLVSGSLTMGSGGILVVSGHNYNNMDDELGLYLSSPFSDPANILDYLEWGSTGHQRSSVATAAGIWTGGDFLAGITGALSFEYDGVGDLSSDWALSLGPTDGENNSNTGSECDASLFSIGNQSICTGESHTFQVILTGVAPWSFIYTLNGVPQETVVTESSNHMLTLDQDGEYLMLSIQDAACSGNAEGVISLEVSDPPTATLTEDGVLCANNGEGLEVQLTGNAPWTLNYQIDGVDQDEVQLSESPDFLAANSEGLYTLVSVSNSICDGSVEGSVAVTLETVEGGTINYEGSTDDLVICVDDGVDENLAIIVDGPPSNDNNAFVITDELGEILAVNDGGPINFEGAGEGVCLIWNLGYSDGLEGLEVGNTAPDDLVGCFDLSNSISVIREVGMDCVTGIEEEFISEMNIFPNPIGDELRLSFNSENSSRINLIIADIQGRIIDRRSVNGSFEHQVLFDTSSLARGFYALEVRDDQGNSMSYSLVK